MANSENPHNVKIVHHLTSKKSEKKTKANLEVFHLWENPFLSQKYIIQSYSPIEVVQSIAKWKRAALSRYDLLWENEFIQI